MRDVAIHKREGDVIAGTFGRGVFILDDYSALREMTAQTLTERARLYPLRDAYQYFELNQYEATSGNTTYPNPPYGAMLTYSIGQAADAKMAIQIADDQGIASFRTSETCDLDRSEPLVGAVDEAIAALLGLPLNLSEPIQGQRYAVGQEFKPHTDTFEPTGADYFRHCAESGNRSWTAMIYLNQPEDGGRAERAGRR